MFHDGHRIDAHKYSHTAVTIDEMGRDIASFAIDGGVIVYGVAEQKNAPPVLNPIPLADLSERIELVAGTRISEPLSVRTTAIPSSTPGLGYLVVHVPKSPRAPHMVDGKYHGRDEKTKRVLHNQEVVLHLERQMAIPRDIGLTAQEELARAHKAPGWVRNPRDPRSPDSLRNPRGQ